MKNIVAIVLGGGRGTRLLPLTQYRSKPAVPLAGKYRLIDIPISNCINSEINRIYVLTQFQSTSLHRHIRGTYWFDPFSGGFVEILAAQQTMEESDEKRHWYQGTADAVRKNLRHFIQPDTEYVLILSGDQLYRMDFREMLATHRATGANVTIAGKPVNRCEASSLGIMRIDTEGSVVGFLEKPQTDSELKDVALDPTWLESRGIQADGRDCLASMGIYLFDRETLTAVLDKTSYQDFGKEVFPAAIRSRRVKLHVYDDYWEDIGTIRAFYEANLRLAQPNPPFELASATAPIYSRSRSLPPTRADGVTMQHSLVADGCMIGGGTRIENSVVGLRCPIGSNVTIRNSIIMGVDFYETPDQLAANRAAGCPPIGIGDGAVIENAIVDKNCHIGAGAQVIGNPEQVERIVGESWEMLDGIVIVPKASVLPDGWRRGEIGARSLFR
ncbi:MAG TPA: glucose-1-phosphate adenylyltransferase [Lacipirellulaceae bacterium]|nr:glucose-1-phosphate adenylyltransferase [Lacipirellulaceae bacterium]